MYLGQSDQVTDQENAQHILGILVNQIITSIDKVQRLKVFPEFSLT